LCESLAHASVARPGRPSLDGVRFRLRCLASAFPPLPSSSLS